MAVKHRVKFHFARVSVRVIPLAHDSDAEAQSHVDDEGCLARVWIETRGASIRVRAALWIRQPDSDHGWACDSEHEFSTAGARHALLLYRRWVEHFSRLSVVIASDYGWEYW